jgi:hypothetical protein
MERDRRLKKIGLKKMAQITGDPMVTPGQNMESINTFKDMYGIFKCKNLSQSCTAKMLKTGSISPRKRPKSSKIRVSMNNLSEYGVNQKSRATSHHSNRHSQDVTRIGYSHQESISKL